MATFQLSGSLVAGKGGLPSFNGLRPSQPTFAVPSSVGAYGLSLDRRSFRGLTVKAATVVAPKVYNLHLGFNWDLKLIETCITLLAWDHYSDHLAFGSALSVKIYWNFGQWRDCRNRDMKYWY